MKKYSTLLFILLFILVYSCSSRKNISGRRSTIDSLNAATADSIKLSGSKQ